MGRTASSSNVQRAQVPGVQAVVPVAAEPTVGILTRAPSTVSSTSSRVSGRLGDDSSRRQQVVLPGAIPTRQRPRRNKSDPMGSSSRQYMNTSGTNQNRSSVAEEPPEMATSSRRHHRSSGSVGGEDPRLPGTIPSSRKITGRNTPSEPSQMATSGRHTRSSMRQRHHQRSRSVGGEDPPMLPPVGAIPSRAPRSRKGTRGSNQPPTGDPNTASDQDENGVLPIQKPRFVAHSDSSLSRKEQRKSRDNQVGQFPSNSLRKSSSRQEEEKSEIEGAPSNNNNNHYVEDPLFQDNDSSSHHRDENVNTNHDVWREEPEGGDGGSQDSWSSEESRQPPSSVDDELHKQPDLEAHAEPAAPLLEATLVTEDMLLNDQSPVAANHNNNNKQVFYLILIAMTLLFLLAVIVVGIVCGTGSCTVSPTVPVVADSPVLPVVTNTPTVLRVTSAPTPAPAAATPGNSNIFIFNQPQTFIIQGNPVSTEDTVLDLSNEELTGTIPIQQIIQMTNLVVLNLAGNSLSSVIPSELGLLGDTLLSLNLAGNMLSGMIPSELSLLAPSLDSLDLSNNTLSGTIPTELARLASASSLTSSNNETGDNSNESSGRVLQPQQQGKPQRVGSKLHKVHLHTNILQGPIPSQFGQLPLLKYLSLDNNDLTGQVPFQVCSIILQSNGTLTVDFDKVECCCCLLDGSENENGNINPAADCLLSNAPIDLEDLEAEYDATAEPSVETDEASETVDPTPSPTLLSTTSPPTAEETDEASETADATPSPTLLSTTSQPTAASMTSELIEDSEALRAAIIQWRDTGESPYGDISDWDVSRVDDFTTLFQGMKDFSPDLSRWQTSQVTTLSNMFNGATHFNSDLNAWDVSNVHNMDNTFNGDSSFNCDLNNWNVANVTSMQGMFSNANVFNGDISNWDVSRVTSGFQFGRVFNTDISGWNVSKITSLNSMFRKVYDFNLDISSWDVSNVVDMDGAFRETNAFNIDISQWDVSKAFEFAKGFNQPIQSWNVENSGNFQQMFRGAESFNQDLCDWGSRIQEGANVEDMFGGSADSTPSGCVVIADPVYDSDSLKFDSMCELELCPGSPQ